VEIEREGGWILDFFRTKKCVIECSVFFIFQTEKVQITLEDCNVVFRLQAKERTFDFFFCWNTRFVGCVGNLDSY
jgi:hypothetical protein